VFGFVENIAQPSLSRDREIKIEKKNALDRILKANLSWSRIWTNCKFIRNSTSP